MQDQQVRIHPDQIFTQKMRQNTKKT